MAKDLNIPVYNYGRTGMGNVGIFHRLIEADIKHQFTDGDLIITQWSKWNREDRYLENGWVSVGGLPDRSGFYDINFMRKYWSEENDVVKSATAIIAANKLYDCMNLTISEFPIYRNLVSPEVTFYYDHLPPAIDMSSDIHNNHFDGELDGRDTHPDVRAHLELVEKHIYPRIGLTLKESTKLDVERVFQEIKLVAAKVFYGDISAKSLFAAWEKTGWKTHDDLELFGRAIKAYNNAELSKIIVKW